MLNDKPIKIFVSLPMKGHSTEDIIKRRDLVINKFESACEGISPKYEVINQIWDTDNIPNPNNKIWCLGKSIQALGEADLVIFAAGWPMANGCVVERLICDLYKIPKIDEADL